MASLAFRSKFSCALDLAGAAYDALPDPFLVVERSLKITDFESNKRVITWEIASCLQSNASFLERLPCFVASCQIQWLCGIWYSLSGVVSARQELVDCTNDFIRSTAHNITEKSRCSITMLDISRDFCMQYVTRMGNPWDLTDSPYSQVSCDLFYHFSALELSIGSGTMSV